MYWFCSFLGISTGFLWMGLLIYQKRQVSQWLSCCHPACRTRDVRSTFFEIIPMDGVHLVKLPFPKCKRGPIRPRVQHKRADAFSLAATVAPTEAVRRGSMLSATSSVSSPDGTRTRVTAAVDNLAYVAEESFEQRL